MAAAATPVTASKPAAKSAAGALLDEKIVVHRRSSGPANQEALDRVKSATMAIHSRLNKSGQLRSGIPIDNKGPDAGAFHATLEINDFPRKLLYSFIRCRLLTHSYRKSKMGCHKSYKHRQSSGSHRHFDNNERKLLCSRKTACSRTRPQTLYPCGGRHGIGCYKCYEGVETLACGRNGSSSGQRVACTNGDWSLQRSVMIGWRSWFNGLHI